MYSYIYRSIQNILLKKSFYDDVNKIISSHKKFKNVVEIGCADALILKKFDKSLKYFGYEIEKNYILKLKKNYLNNKKYFFYNKGIENINFINFDAKNTIIILIGVFHHIPDNSIKLFLKKTKNFSVYAVDAVRLNDQNFFTKLLLDNDRGKFIRNLNEYKKILKGYKFNIARNKYLRVSYDHLISYRNLNTSFINEI